MTVHDVLPITHPQLFPQKSVEVQRQKFNSVRRADMVLTTCSATASDIVEVLGVDPDRVAVAALGPLDAVASEGPSLLAGPYVLAVGALTPRKGFETLARAIGIMPDCPAVAIVGPDGWKANDVRRSIEMIDREGKIRFLGPVSDQHLARLYRDATVVCHPSVAEGFGIVCVEAMHAGAPLVATDIASVRETTNGCAMLVPVGDEEALADALTRVIADEPLRKKLVADARLRAQKYTWRAMAAGVVEAYTRALSSPRI